MKKIIGICLAVILVISSCATTKSVEKTVTIETPVKVVTLEVHEMEVINYLLSMQELPGKEFLIDKNILISSYTSKNQKQEVMDIGAFISSKFVDIDKKALANFIDKNSEKMSIDKTTEFNTKFKWLDDIELIIGKSNSPFEYWNKLRAPRKTSFKGTTLISAF